jgi:hypothetical protein
VGHDYIGPLDVPSIALSCQWACDENRSGRLEKESSCRLGFKDWQFGGLDEVYGRFLLVSDLYQPH